MTQPDPTDEQRQFELLEAYLERLERGHSRERQAILDQDPHLAPALDCLEALVDFGRAPPPTLPADEPTRTQPAPTCAHGDDAPAAAMQLASSAGPSASNLPRQFGDYQLLEEIGRGGMGVVYRAYDQSLHRTVALKMILASQLASAQQVRRFESEAQAAAGLRHPHIVRLLDSGQVEGQPYLAMDFIEGSSLASLIARGPLEPDAAARYVASVARAVDYLHRQGVVHRDLKPSNILLDEEGEPYLTDFGLAKMLSADPHLTASGFCAGTPSYMAPEQAAARGEAITPLADVYSLGAILYELLTGRPPFQAASALDVLIQVLEREPTVPRQLNPRIPRPLEWIALRCLEKAPENRYASAAALADDLDRFLRGELVEARPPRAWQRLRRWARREPALASRLGAFSLFYLVESVNYYALGKWDWDFHYLVTAILLVWVAACAAFQRLMKHPRAAAAIPFAWGAVDAACLLSLLLIANGAVSPLLVGYPLLIVCAGLWFRVRLVWFMTALAAASYLLLIADYYLRRPELAEQFSLTTDHHIFLLVGWLVLGTVVAHQVRRVRSLSRYYEHRRLP